MSSGFRPTHFLLVFVPPVVIICPTLVRIPCVIIITPLLNMFLLLYVPVNICVSNSPADYLLLVTCYNCLLLATASLKWLSGTKPHLLKWGWVKLPLRGPPHEGFERSRVLKLKAPIKAMMSKESKMNKRQNILSHFTFLERKRKTLNEKVYPISWLLMNIY